MLSEPKTRSRNLRPMSLRLLWFITDLSGSLRPDYNLLPSIIFGSLRLCARLSGVFGLYLDTCETQRPLFTGVLPLQPLSVSISHHPECPSSAFPSTATTNQINEPDSLAVCVSAQIGVFPPSAAKPLGVGRTDGWMVPANDSDVPLSVTRIHPVVMLQADRKSLLLWASATHTHTHTHCYFSQCFVFGSAFSAANIFMSLTELEA